jgi:hypothetical protein
VIIMVILIVVYRSPVLWLPSVRGPVFSPAQLPAADVAVYVTGAILVEPSLVSATSVTLCTNLTEINDSYRHHGRRQSQHG